ncbi:MAG: hypothetical protein JSR60_14335 [Proteobacteria bacterium]|nr:hypothetical protein [Pseudomonadota bacterium]
MKALNMLKGAAVAALLLAPVQVLAAGAADEITTAATHADLAAKAGAIDGVHMHLHHTLNCLVGPGGEGFDPKNINPCANSGTGAIPDSTDKMQKAALEAAAATARAGIAAADLAVAQKDAADTAKALMAIK